MAKTYYEIEQETKLWLKDKLDEGRIVFKRNELKDSNYKYLKNENLLADLLKGYFFLKQEHELTHSAFKLHYWKILIQFLNLRFPEDGSDPSWYLTGNYPYEFLVDNIKIPEINEQITISTKSNSNTILKLLDDHRIIASTDKRFDEQTIIKKDIFGDDIQLLKQEALIINSNPTQYQLYEQNIVAYMKQKSFDKEYIADYFKRNKSPILHARLLGALEQIGDQIFFVDLKNIFDQYDYKNAIENPFSRDYKLQKPGKPAYTTRFMLSMQDAINTLEKIKIPRRLNKKIASKDIDNLLIEDTYNSLTIEGYDVTKELIAKVIDNENYQIDDNLRNLSATKGFMKSLALIKSLIKQKSLPLTEDISEALWKELWSPSINAGIFKHEINTYRNHMVAIKGSNTVPPGHEKIHYLLEEFFNIVNDIENGFHKAIFAHYFYVSIHPHSDGNGRVSRFLMNLALINDKYKWLTIKHTDRDEYFAALENSQLEDDISHFANFIIKAYKE